MQIKIDKLQREFKIEMITTQYKLAEMEEMYVTKFQLVSAKAKANGDVARKKGKKFQGLE